MLLPVVSLFLSLVSADSGSDAFYKSIAFYNVCERVVEHVATEDEVAAIRVLTNRVHEEDCKKAADKLWDVEVLDLSDTDFRVSNVFSGLQRLRYLMLSRNSISLLHLSQMSELRGVFAVDSNVEDVEFVDLPSLGEIRLRGNHIRQIKLQGLDRVDVVDMSQNGLSDASFLKNIPTATWVRVDENRLTQLDLKGFYNLKVLYFGDNAIDSLNFVKDIGAVVDLHGNNNSIQSVAPLSQLNYLQKVDLKDNRIEDVSPLVNVKLDYFLSLQLEGNPIVKDEAHCPIQNDFIELSNFCRKWRAH